MTFSHLRQERLPSARQHTYSPVINTQAFKNICDQKGLCFLISFRFREVESKSESGGGAVRGRETERGRERETETKERYRETDTQREM